MSVFSLLYRVFYDKNLATDFMRNGTGRGGKALFALSVLIALMVSVQIFLTMSQLMELPVEKITGSLPDIVIKNDQIVEPENYYSTYSDPEKNIYFILDTFSDKVVLPKEPPVGIYMSKNSLVIQSGNEFRALPFKKLLKGKTLILNQEKMEQIFKTTMQALRNVLPFVFFILLIPGMFLFYVITSYFYGLMSYLMTYAMRRELGYDERMRLAVLSMTPWTILNALASLLGVHIRFGFASGLLLTLIYMFCFLKEDRTKQI